MTIGFMHMIIEHENTSIQIALVGENVKHHYTSGLVNQLCCT